VYVSPFRLNDPEGCVTCAAHAEFAIEAHCTDPLILLSPGKYLTSGRRCKLSCNRQASMPYSNPVIGITIQFLICRLVV
jgi:hypothetical protein